MRNVAYRSTPAIGLKRDPAIQMPRLTPRISAPTISACATSTPTNRRCRSKRACSGRQANMGSTSLTKYIPATLALSCANKTVSASSNRWHGGSLTGARRGASAWLGKHRTACHSVPIDLPGSSKRRLPFWGGGFRLAASAINFLGLPVQCPLGPLSRGGSEKSIGVGLPLYRCNLRDTRVGWSQRHPMRTGYTANAGQERAS